jgi:hypothetical protein
VSLGIQGVGGDLEEVRPGGWMEVRADKQLACACQLSERPQQLAVTSHAANPSPRAMLDGGHWAASPASPLEPALGL